MRIRTKNNKLVITSVVLSLMMVLAMMPGMAFATSVVEGYDIAIQNPGPLTTADSPQLTTNVTKPADAGETHVEWASDNADVATIGKNKGTLAIKSAGTVTVTAELRSGKSGGGQGTGGGEGTGGTTSGDLLATDSITLTITKAEYGFQGLGGNTLMLTVPSDITAFGTTQLNGLTKYNNEIDEPVAAPDGILSFGYTMSAGFNNFQEATFDTYKDQIQLCDEDGNPIDGVSFEYGGFANKTVTINANVSHLDAGSYILRFGPKVCGNNADKKLACYIDFAFVLE